jgi:WD40 repeat protein
MVLIGGEFSQDKITLMLNNNLLIEKKITYSVFEKGFTDDIVNSTQLNITMNKMGEYYTNDFNKKAIQFCNKGKILVIGGFYDGKIVIFSLEDKKQVELIPFNDDCPILSLHISQDDDYLLLGNSMGNVAIYKIEPEIDKWKQIKIIPDQKSAISHIYCNSDLNMWVSTSIDGYINLYTLPLCKLARTIKISSQNCSYSFLSSSPLPSIVIINDEANSEIIVYSINGKLIYKHQLYFKLSNPIIIKDLNSNENLAYIGKDAITILSLPKLETLININITPKMGITTIFTSEDKKSLYCINKTGNGVYLIRDELKKNIRAATIALKNI